MHAAMQKHYSKNLCCYREIVSEHHQEAKAK